jgi:hypothetical protein
MLTKIYGSNRLTPYVFLTDAFTGEFLDGRDVGRGGKFFHTYTGDKRY